MFGAMRTKLLVEEAADKLIELQPDSETTEEFLGKVVAEVVLRKHQTSERSDAMEAAIARGLVARKELELAEGGSISTDEMAKKMGIQRQAVDHKRKQNQLIAWRDAQGHWRFPRWQIDLKTAKPLKGPRLVPRSSARRRMEPYAILLESKRGTAWPA